MKLQPSDTGKLMKAMVESFDQDTLDTLFMERFNHTTTRYAGQVVDDEARALRIVKEFQSRNEIELLIALLRDARPKVLELAELAQTVGLFTPPQDSGALQVVVRPGKGGTIGHDPRQFRKDLAAREDTICRIVVDGTRFGTGTLVGPDLVLTNYHVVKTVLQDQGSLGGTVVCEFDYRLAASGYTTPATRVKATAAIASSMFAPEDLASTPVNASTAFLDYALLRIEQNLADAPIIGGGDPRGYTRLAPPPASALAARQGVLVLQHPDAQPLRLDVGAVSEAFATRIRHTADTLGGSSGAPVFDGDLAFAALHHAGYDWPRCDPPVNQAIPIGLIVADLAAKGVAL